MGFTSDFSEIYIIHRFNYICIITLEPEVNDRDLKDLKFITTGLQIVFIVSFVDSALISLFIDISLSNSEHYILYIVYHITPNYLAIYCLKMINIRKYLLWVQDIFDREPS